MQEIRSWVSSPLGQHILLAMFKDTGGSLNHFLKKCVNLKNKPEFSTSNKYFVAPCALESYLKDDIHLEIVESPSQEALSWANKYSHVNTDGLKKNIPKFTQMVLLNFSSYQSPWARENGNSLMKIYNSFSYTQDVNYEARILELPLHDREFKLVVIAPNDVDLLHTLFNRMSRDGLAAAICNIQPVFTTNSKLMPPHVRFTSEETIDETLGTLGVVTITQFGQTNINEKGAEFSVLSYLYVTAQPRKPKETEVKPGKKQPFFFGLVYQDIPIFTGQFDWNEQ